MQLRWTEEAARDLEGIADDLFEHAPERAADLVRQIYECPLSTVELSPPWPARQENGNTRSRALAATLYCGLPNFRRHHPYRSYSARCPEVAL